MCLGADDVTTTAVGNPLIGDVETEQLLSEIELLTSRTLHETNQARISHGNHLTNAVHSMHFAELHLRTKLSDKFLHS